MCIVQDGEKQLLIGIPNTSDEMFAHLVEGQKEWTIKGKFPGMKNRFMPCMVLTDGRGHLFVADNYNHVVHMFSTGGQYKGMAYQSRLDGIGVMT